MSKPAIPTQQGYRITSGYGWRTHPISKQRKFHGGLDFAPEKAGTKGWKVFAMRDGEIIQIGNHSIMGKYVIIKHSTDKYYSLYQHLEKIYYNKGTKVKQGQAIGIMGTTGSSTGIHLHLVIGKGYPINQSAGGNTIDPAVYMRMDNNVSSGSTSKVSSKNGLQHLANEVKKGTFGTGHETRKDNIYTLVRNRVNGVGSKTQFEDVVSDVKKGVYGNGHEGRAEKIYAKVRALVNK